MKKITAIILCLVCLFLTACSVEDSFVPAGMKKLASEDGEYTLYIPDNWTEDTNMGVPAAYYPDSTYGNDFANISFVAFGGESSAESFWEKNKESLQKTFADIEFETEAENMLVGGVSAVRYVYTATVTDSKYKYMQIAIYREGIVYLFTYTALEEYYGDHYGEDTSDINMILENIKFD